MAYSSQPWGGSSYSSQGHLAVYTPHTPQSQQPSLMPNQSLPVVSPQPLLPQPTSPQIMKSQPLLPTPTVVTQPVTSLPQRPITQPSAIAPQPQPSLQQPVPPQSITSQTPQTSQPMMPVFPQSEPQIPITSQSLPFSQPPQSSSQSSSQSLSRPLASQTPTISEISVQPSALITPQPIAQPVAPQPIAHPIEPQPIAQQPISHSIASDPFKATQQPLSTQPQQQPQLPLQSQPQPHSAQSAQPNIISSFAPHLEHPELISSDTTLVRLPQNRAPIVLPPLSEIAVSHDHLPPLPFGPPIQVSHITLKPREHREAQVVVASEPFQSMSLSEKTDPILPPFPSLTPAPAPTPAPAQSTPATSTIETIASTTEVVDSPTLLPEPTATASPPVPSTPSWLCQPLLSARALTDSQAKCIMCWKNPIDTFNIPCNHSVLCVVCANSLMFAPPKCNVCDQITNLTLHFSGFALPPDPSFLKSIRSHECPICQQQKETNHFVAIQRCGHLVCMDCLVGHVRAALSDRSLFPIRCPTHCGHEITSSNLKYLASCSGLTLEQSELEKVERFEIESSGGEKFECPGCHKLLLGANALVHGNCPYCSQSIATLAPIPTAADLLSDQTISRSSKSCPRCKAPITHYHFHGCHHITCPCKYEFCYVCCGPAGKCGCKWQGSTFCDPDCGCLPCPDCYPNHPCKTCPGCLRCFQ
eukprot:c7288_g1_i1.p1 GENE.c7288_g1_i1~~c7288_g1_i1.p1  ORF type:complete len:731 (+),score=135.52 c7288_g1_i1:96-2195(+)